MAKRAMLRAGLLGALLCSAAPAFAAPVDIEADEISRDANGVVIARGHVVIKRESETLTADEVRYQSEHALLTAIGHVVITSPKATINADEAMMHTGSKTGEMKGATITLPDGARIQAANMHRIDDRTYEADQAYFSRCPIDEESWRVAASHAVVDQEAGVMTADHARFELWHLPVFYSPWWQQPLGRKSGLLMPSVNSGKRRGTEVALPLYLAPSDNFDVTLTPHWMSARGVMGEGELRHVSGLGHEEIAAHAIRDAVTQRTRSYLTGDVHWRLPTSLYFDATANHVSDNDYLADFGGDSLLVSRRYMSSQASLSQRYLGESFIGSWSLSTRHQQNLLTASNARTLQLLPRLQSAMSWQLAPLLLLHLDQQTTRFDRRTGIIGWRADVHPYLEVPWELAGGGVSATVTAGLRHTRYWLAQTTLLDRQPIRNAPQIGVEVRSDFERISDDRTWRHVVSPIVRYDYVDAPIQTGAVNFDSAWSRLTWSNLMSGNRFSGYDRVEGTNRFSAVLENRFQYKSGDLEAARDVLLVRGGVSYDLLRRVVDATLQRQVVARPFSNLLGEVNFAPTTWWSLTSSGQYNPSQRYWASLNASTSLRVQGASLSVGYSSTDARYAGESQLLTVAGSARLLGRWNAGATWQYDILQKFTQRTVMSASCEHPCWKLGLEAYRINRPSGTTSASNTGFQLILEFKGMGA